MSEQQSPVTFDSFEIQPRTKSYYDRVSIEDSLAISKEMIEEWSYSDDPHGYCHTRPVLMCLVKEITSLRRQVVK